MTAVDPNDCSIFVAENKDDGGYVAIVLEMPGCIGTGDTKEEAIADVKAAMLAWLEEWNSANERN